MSKMIGGHRHVAGGFARSKVDRAVASRELARKDRALIEAAKAVRTCRKCGCTQDDYSQCIAKTGAPCHWVGEDKCSACFSEEGVELPAAQEENE